MGLIIMGLFFGLCTICVTHIPLQLGRNALQYFETTCHDFYNWSVGMVGFYSFCSSANYIWKWGTKMAAASDEAYTGISKVLSSTAHVVKSISIVIIWLTLPPFLIGFLLETAIMVPLTLGNE